MTIRPATEADVDAIAASEADNLGADAWSEHLLAEGLTGRLPTIHYLVAEAVSYTHLTLPTNREV